MARTYGIADCPLAVTLDVIGDRWTLLLLRDLLLLGPRRFNDFQAAFPGVAPNTLSVRLKEMEDNGLITRELYNERPPRVEYQLTAKGKSLGPIVKAMRDWGAAHELAGQSATSRRVRPVRSGKSRQA
jgi:DNA-binding HxlR family transcriptional regulator